MTKLGLSPRNLEWINAEEAPLNEVCSVESPSWGHRCCGRMGQVKFFRLLAESIITSTHRVGISYLITWFTTT